MIDSITGAPPKLKRTVHSSKDQLVHKDHRSPSRDMATSKAQTTKENEEFPSWCDRCKESHELKKRDEKKKEEKKKDEFKHSSFITRSKGKKVYTPFPKTAKQPRKPRV